MTPKRASTDLGSSHVFLTGATGFVGQAVLERLLSDHPGTTISILVRAKAGADTAGRVSVLLKKPAFDSWREKVGDAAVEKAAKERIRVVEGEMGSIPQLPKDLDVVIHSASVVSFDPPIDEAFDTNVNGAMQLYENLLAAKGDPRVVHVSTCYVGGLRKGVAPEARLTHEVDWRAEYAAAKTARDRVEQLSRESDQLRVFMDAARAKHEKEGPQAVATASEKARVAWVRAELVDVGRTRAQSLGWTDVYTLTKAFAERAAEELWGENGHRLSVVRPAIIESALRHPFPGWIDGFKVADPLIMAYGRGLLPEFPGLPDSILDVIPVDFVVNAIIAAAANPAEKNAPEYYHVASGASNPLPFHEISGYVNQFFLANPMKDKAGKDIPVPTWKFPVGNKVERDVLRKERLVIRLERLLGRMPDTDRVRRWHTQMIKNIADLETLRNFVQLYRVYVRTEIIFDDRNLRALHAAIPAKLQADRGFDIAAIDWKRYMLEVHIPAITALTKAFSRDRAQSKAAALEAKKPPKELPKNIEGHGGLRPRGHRRRLQHRAAVPLGAHRRRPQGRLAGRGRPHPGLAARPAARRGPRPRRVRPHLPAPLRGDAGRPPRQDRARRLRRHRLPPHQPRRDRGDQGAPRRRASHGAGDRIHPDPRRAARGPVRRGRRRAYARPRRHPDRLPGEAAARRRGACGLGAQVRRGARARPRAVLRLR